MQQRQTGFGGEHGAEHVQPPGVSCTLGQLLPRSMPTSYPNLLTPHAPADVHRRASGGAAAVQQDCKCLLRHASRRLCVLVGCESGMG